MTDQKQTASLSQVNKAKENISTAYSTWYEASPSEKEKGLNERVRTVRDELFAGQISSSGRKFLDVLLTTEELAEMNRYVFKQEDVTRYESPEATKRRRRELKKDPLFEPNVVLGDIVPASQREDREEEIHRSSFEHRIRRELVHRLVTSGLSPIDVLSSMAKSNQLFSNDKWIKEDEWLGENRLSDEEVELKLAIKMAEQFNINLDELIKHHERVVKINASGPTYINSHDQHIVPSAQGGLSQRPVSIASHWYEHMLVANDAAEALEIILPQSERFYEEFEDDAEELGLTLDLDSIHPDQDAVNRLIDLTFFAYQLNAQAAELLRHSIPLYPSLSTKYILEKRKEICTNAKLILEKTESLDPNNTFTLLTPNDISSILSLSERIKDNGGTIVDEIGIESALTCEEIMAVEKLEIVVEKIDCQNTINRLKTCLSKLGRNKIEMLDTKHTQSIQELIGKLEKEQRALYLDMLNSEEYEALLALQDRLDEDILIDIVVPNRIRNVRPAWRYRLDLEDMGDILVNPYDDKGLELRMLLDVLQKPNFKNILSTNSPPRRVPFTQSQLENSAQLAAEVYGDTRHVEILEGLVANNILDKYFESVGITDKTERSKAMFTDRYNEQPPSALQNVDKAADMIYKTILDNGKIATIGDCDQDGFFASINWRWTLEHIGVEKIEQKFNTRIEGHAVQPVDLLNLALEGNSLIIINDTGSSEQDANTFNMIKEGASKLEDLIFFRDNIEYISGYKKLSSHQQRELKKKLTENINKREGAKKELLDLESILFDSITTGRMVENKDGKMVKEYMPLEEFAPFKKFLEGFKDLKIIVCDHHTSSIESINYLRNKEDIVMVNPQWVRTGYEDQFISEMLEALTPDSEGKVDIQKVNSIQRKYICYPESDIVGTVTASKVMGRVIQLFSPDEIVKADASALYSLNRADRYNKYKEIAQTVTDVKLYDSIPSSENSLSTVHIQLDQDKNISLFVGDLWLETGPEEKIEARISQILNSLKYSIREIQESKDFDKAKLLLEEMEGRFPISIQQKEELIEAILDSSLDIDNTKIEDITNTTVKNINTEHNTRIEQLKQTGQLTDAQLRFYLEYADKLPKSLFEMSRDEKEAYVIPYVKMLAQKLEYFIEIENPRNLEVRSINLTGRVEELITEGRSLRDLKKELFDLIEFEYMWISRFDVPNRSRIRYIGNKAWEKATTALLQKGELTPNILRGLNSYFKYGGYGLEFLHLTQAAATLGDGGSVGLDGGLENRALVKRGMEAIEQSSDEYWDAKDKKAKEEIERIQPEILRLIRTSLRGTHIKSINWNLSRLFTHGISAFVNAMYRRAKEERSERAKEFWKEAADFCILRSENENNQRHRHTLVHAQEVSVERREELLKGIIREIESENQDNEKPILITKLEGRKYVDPIQGLRGLIAGELASRYEKPVMVLVEDKIAKNDNPSRYTTSFRLPAKGNIATDMVQLELEKNPVEGIKIETHGGHPEASGGTWVVEGGIDKLHEVLDPIFSNFKLIHPDAGIIKIEKVIKDSIEKLEHDGWEILDKYEKHINSFDIADTIATNMYKQTNPYGSDMPPLIIEFENLTVVSISKGTKNDGDDYSTVKVKDTRGNTKTMRLFNELDFGDLTKIQKGDTITLQAQPIMRLRPLEPTNLQYHIPISADFKPTIVTGQLAKPTLDIVKIINIKRGF